jgi:hypothetical protein
MGGLSGTIITPTTQTVNLTLTTAAAAGRCLSTGADVQFFLEMYADTGANARNVTVNYTDQADAAQVAQVIALPATSRAARMYQVLPTAAVGGYIKSITNCVWDATTGTVGNFGFTAVHRLATIPIAVANSGLILDFAAVGLHNIPPTACLALMVLNSGTTSPLLFGNFDVIEG